MLRAVDIVRRLCPNAHPNYIAAFDAGDAQIATAAIASDLRLAHFLAQVLHETGGLTILVEDHHYSRRNLADAWDNGNWHRYFPNKAALIAMAGQGERLFNIVYGNRMGNSGPETGDGFRYRGRGILQTTGREAYRKYGIRCGVDFEGNPDLVTSAEHALKPALAEWVDGRCNAMADRNAIVEITQRINGGKNGLADRIAWFDKTWKLMQGGVPAAVPSWQAAQPDPDILSVQKDLAALGFEVEPDGRKGPQTVKAIQAFQRSAGLSTDGIAGPVTRAAIKARLDASLTAKAPKPDTADPPAVPNAAGIGGKVVGGGAAGLVVLDQGQKLLDQAQALQSVVPHVPALKYAVAGITTLGVALLVYAVVRPMLRPKPGAPS